MANIIRTGYSQYNPNTASSTVPYSTSSYYRSLVVGIVLGGAAGAPVVDTIEYGGVPLIPAGEQTLNTVTRKAFFYHLPNPLIGSNDLFIECTTGHVIENVIISSYKNVLTSSPVDVSTSGLDGSSPGAWNYTTTVTDAFAVSFLAGYSGLTGYNDGANLSFFSTQSDRRMADSGVLGAPGSKSFSTTFVGGGSSAYFSLALKPAVAIPILNETVLSNIALTSFLASDEVLYDGDSTITERGFVYNTLPNPTVSNSKIVVAGTVGEYSTTISDLEVNTTYYVRAYAINANGTAYGTEVSQATLNINQYELQKDIGAISGQTFIGSINVTGTTGTVTVKFGTEGNATVINAGAGPTTFSGTYEGQSGIIITRSASFDGTIDDVYYVQVPLGTTVDFSLDVITIITAIDASVFFKRIEEKIFNSFAFYRYLDVLFKDLDGFVTVTVRNEREDNSIDISKTFSVGNTSNGTVSPFQKKRISFLIKDQAVIIGFSNANIGETFSIAQFLLTGYKKPEKMFSSSKIISMS